MIKAIINTEFAHWFEEDVIDAISRFQLDGFVTNNLLVPHHVRDLPNEHDIVILLAGRIVTVDAKALWPGTYRRGSAGWDELQADGRWAPTGFHGDPDRVGISKAKVMAGHVQRIQRKHPNIAAPEVISAIVVPDDADISAIRATPSVGRHYTLNVRDLEEALRADVSSKPRARPTPDELVALLEIQTQSGKPTLPMWLGNIELLRQIAVLDVPFRRSLFAGMEQPISLGRSEEPGGSLKAPAGRRLMIEVCERSNRDARPAQIARGFIANYSALNSLDDAGILKIAYVREIPAALVCVYEHFSEHTLESMLASGRTLTWGDARRVFHEIVEALYHAHAKQVFHRLLEPTYILIDLDRTKHPARLFGFWGAKAIEVLTTGIAAPDSPYRLDATTGGDDLALRDMYALNRCLIASLTGDPLRLPARSTVPDAALDAVTLMTSSDQTTRRAALPKLRSALRS